MSLQAILAGLDEAGVRYVIIGEVASTVHGSTCAVGGLEVCYAGDADNIEALLRLLRRSQAHVLGVRHPGPVTLDARTLRMSETLSLTTARGELDLCRRVRGVGDYSACVRRSEVASVGGVRRPVLDLPALIDAARAAPRPKDADHLTELEALLERTERA